MERKGKKEEKEGGGAGGMPARLRNTAWQVQPLLGATVTSPKPPYRRAVSYCSREKLKVADVFHLCDFIKSLLISIFIWTLE